MNTTVTVSDGSAKLISNIKIIKKTIDKINSTSNFCLFFCDLESADLNDSLNLDNCDLVPLNKALFYDLKSEIRDRLQDEEKRLINLLARRLANE